MTSFLYIISSFFPDINIKGTAFYKSTTTDSVMNTNFIEYSYLNSLHVIPVIKLNSSTS